MTQALRYFFELVPVTVEEDTPYIKFTCTCEIYWLHRACQHSLGLTLLKKMVEVPPRESITVLKSVPTKGRPCIPRLQ